MSLFDIQKIQHCQKLSVNVIQCECENVKVPIYFNRHWLLGCLIPSQMATQVQRSVGWIPVSDTTHAVMMLSMTQIDLE